MEKPDGQKVDSDESGKVQDSATQKQTDEPKLYEESVVKDIISQRDTLKERIRTIESKIETETLAREKEELEKKGDYESLQQKLLDKEIKMKSAIKNKAAEFELGKLGAKHQILKTEYLDIFNADLDVDEDSLTVKNAEDVEKAFLKFKEDNPTLFASEDKSKPVPKADNFPFLKAKKAEGKNSPIIPLADILQQRANNKTG